MTSQELRGSAPPESVVPDPVPPFSDMGVRPASRGLQKSKIPSGIKTLDEFLEGGLPRGAVSEWGMPLGSGGRELLLPWLKGNLSLWVYSRTRLTVYPPAWAARGIPLENLRFAQTTRPLTDLKPVFLEPLFRLIVLDGPRSFTEEDCAFLARQARANDQVVLLIRDAFLGPKRGNVWAKLRLNAWWRRSGTWESSGTDSHFHLRVVRGLSPREFTLDTRAVQRNFDL